MSSFQSLLQKRAGLAASRVTTKRNTVDMTGRDYEDYQSLLELHVLEKLNDVDNDIANGAEGKARWVSTLLRNRTIDYQRQLTVANYMFSRTGDMATPPVPVVGDLEDQLVNRDLLRRLQATLAVSDWSLLMAYLEHETVRSAWEAVGGQETERAFGRKLQRVLTTCRKILQKIVN